MVEHRFQTGHRLFATRGLDEFPLAIEPDEVSKLGNEFCPSVMTLYRITKVLSTQELMTRTALSQSANVHYGRLSKYLILLGYRHYIEYVIQAGKIRLRLTDNGKKFGEQLNELVVAGELRKDLQTIA